MTEPLGSLGPALAALESLGADYALIGGWAVIAWGYVRASDDVDLLAELPPEKRGALLKALDSAFEAEWIAPGQDDPLPGIVRATPRNAGLPIEIIPSRGESDRLALSRALSVDIGGRPVKVIRPEDLIAMKLDAGGGQDYEDVRRLREVLGTSLDMDMLRAACRDRGVLEKLEGLSGR